MIKFVYLLWPRRRMTPLEYRLTLLDGCAPQLLKIGAVGLQINIADDRADTPSPSPRLLGPPPWAAQVSLWLEDESPRAAHEDVLRAAASRSPAIASTNGSTATTARRRTPGRATGPTASAAPACSP